MLAKVLRFNSCALFVTARVAGYSSNAIPLAPAVRVAAERMSFRFCTADDNAMLEDLSELEQKLSSIQSGMSAGLSSDV
eukprot:SAG31_NODE_36704_length_311_cov_0.726415_1_plen_78_part_01